MLVCGIRTVLPNSPHGRRRIPATTIESGECARRGFAIHMDAYMDMCNTCTCNVHVSVRKAGRRRRRAYGALRYNGSRGGPERRRRGRIAAARSRPTPDRYVQSRRRLGTRRGHGAFYQNTLPNNCVRTVVFTSRIPLRSSSFLYLLLRHYLPGNDRTCRRYLQLRALYFTLLFSRGPTPRTPRLILLSYIFTQRLINYLT